MKNLSFSTDSVYLLVKRFRFRAQPTKRDRFISISLENSKTCLLLSKTWSAFRKGSRDGAVVRALASHQCGPGSIPGLGVICGLSLLLVLVLAPRGFSPGTPVPLFSKTNISKFQFDLESEGHRFV